MVTAVLFFGLINVVLEMILLSMLPPRLRLKILGNPNYRNLVHVFFLMINLIIHWGTVVGTMSAVMAFVASIVAVRIAMSIFGYVVDGRYYHVGFIKYSLEEIR